jgi:hypothetical protein
MIVAYFKVISQQRSAGREKSDGNVSEICPPPGTTEEEASSNYSMMRFV